MIKKLFVLALLLVVLMVAASGVSAITYGQPDGEAHPYVVFLIFGDSTGYWRCTGTQLSPTVILTAGHCTSGATVALAYFGSDLTGKVTLANGTPGTAYTHPNYTGAIPNTGDVGVVVLNSPVPSANGVYGALPELGFLDGLATQRGQQQTLFTSVGYGVQSIKPVEQADYVRYRATSNLVSLRSALTDGYNIHLSNNPGKGNGVGGTCFGDSGGPTFYGDSNLVVAVTSFGLNSNCKGADFSYRMDIAESQNWVRSFLG